MLLRGLHEPVSEPSLCGGNAAAATAPDISATHVDRGLRMERLAYELLSKSEMTLAARTVKVSRDVIAGYATLWPLAVGAGTIGGAAFGAGCGLVSNIEINGKQADTFAERAATTVAGGFGGAAIGAGIGGAAWAGLPLAVPACLVAKGMLWMFPPEKKSE